MYFGATRLRYDNSGAVTFTSIAYDAFSRTTVLNFDNLNADHYTLQVLTGVEKIMDFLPSPGGSDEHFTLFVGRADLSQAAAASASTSGRGDAPTIGYARCWVIAGDGGSSADRRASTSTPASPRRRRLC